MGELSRSVALSRLDSDQKRDFAFFYFSEILRDSLRCRCEKRILHSMSDILGEIKYVRNAPQNTSTSGEHYGNGQQPIDFVGQDRACSIFDDFVSRLFEYRTTNFIYVAMVIVYDER